MHQSHTRARSSRWWICHTEIGRVGLFYYSYPGSITEDQAIHSVPRELHPFCGVAALILGKALADSRGNFLSRDKRTEWRKLNRVRYLRKQYANLCRRSHVSYTRDGVSLKGMKDLIENEFSDYQVVIYSTRSYNTPIAVENTGGQEGSMFYVVCHRGFYGQDCFDRHRRPGMSPLLRGARNTGCKSFVACVLCNCDLKAVDGVST